MNTVDTESFGHNGSLEDGHFIHYFGPLLKVNLNLGFVKISNFPNRSVISGNAQKPLYIFVFFVFA